MARSIRSKRKHATRRAPPPTSLPTARSCAALGLKEAAAKGCLWLQVCGDCGAVQYPPREACHTCLSDRLDWRPQDGRGELISDTVLHHSNESCFRALLPLRIGLVRLDGGANLVAFVHADCPPAPARVRVCAGLDRAGQVVLAALPDREDATMAEDRVLRAIIFRAGARKP